MAYEYSERDLYDDADGDMYALFVLEDVTITAINKILQEAYDDQGYNILWLADSYDTIEDIGQTVQSGQHRPQVNEQWKSPFLGKSIQDAVEFVKGAPKPPKALNKVHFVVLDKRMYETEGTLRFCKIVDGEAQSVPCTAAGITTFLEGYDRHTWEEILRVWQEEGTQSMV